MVAVSYMRWMKNREWIAERRVMRIVCMWTAQIIYCNCEVLSYHVHWFFLFLEHLSVQPHISCDTHTHTHTHTKHSMTTPQLATPKRYRKIIFDQKHVRRELFRRRQAPEWCGNGERMWFLFDKNSTNQTTDNRHVTFSRIPNHTLAHTLAYLSISRALAINTIFKIGICEKSEILSFDIFVCLASCRSIQCVQHRPESNTWNICLAHGLITFVQSYHSVCVWKDKVVKYGCCRSWWTVE